MLRRSGSTILGSAIASEITTRGTATFIGKEINTPSDLAAITQVFRNQKYETLRYFFTSGNKIVGQTGVSSRLPSAAMAFPIPSALENAGQQHQKAGARRRRRSSPVAHKLGKVEGSPHHRRNAMKRIVLFRVGVLLQIVGTRKRERD